MLHVRGCFSGPLSSFNQFPPKLKSYVRDQRGCWSVMKRAFCWQEAGFVGQHLPRLCAIPPPTAPHWTVFIHTFHWLTNQLRDVVLHVRSVSAVNCSQFWGSGFMCFIMAVRPRLYNLDVFSLSLKEFSSYFSHKNTEIPRPHLTVARTSIYEMSKQHS